LKIKIFNISPGYLGKHLRPRLKEGVFFIGVNFTGEDKIRKHPPSIYF